MSVDQPPVRSQDAHHLRDRGTGIADEAEHRHGHNHVEPSLRTASRSSGAPGDAPVASRMVSPEWRLAGLPVTTGSRPA